MVLQNVIQNIYYCLISDMRVERQDPQTPDRFKRRVVDWKVEEKSYRCILPDLANVMSTNPTITSWLASISYVIVMALILMTLAGYDVVAQLPGEGEVMLT